MIVLPLKTASDECADRGTRGTHALHRSAERKSHISSGPSLFNKERFHIRKQIFGYLKPWVRRQLFGFLRDIFVFGLSVVALLTISAWGRGCGVVGAVVRAVCLITEVQHYDLPGREGFSLAYITVIVIMVIEIITMNITIFVGHPMSRKRFIYFRHQNLHQP